MSAQDDLIAAEAALTAALSAPKTVTTDGMTVEEHSLPDQIAAAQYQAGRAAGRRPPFGLRMVQLKPPGSA